MNLDPVEQFLKKTDHVNLDVKKKEEIRHRVLLFMENNPLPRGVKKKWI